MAPKPPTSARESCEICILAGGLSRRMGRDKSRLRLGRRSMLGVIRAAAEATGLPVRVIRRDSVARCGPLGGIYTALKRTRAQAVLFLACDMPFVSSELIRQVISRARGPSPEAQFVRTSRKAGFPFLLGRAALPVVEAQIGRREFALQALARALQARVVILPRRFAGQLRNINTLADWAQARRAFARTSA